MRIFVAGATGVLGRRLLPLLVQAGHTVRGVARSDEKATQLGALGVEPSRISLFDPVGVRRAVLGCEAVIHVATRIPPMARGRKREAWAENDRTVSESRDFIGQDLSVLALGPAASTAPFAPPMTLPSPAQRWP